LARTEKPRLQKTLVGNGSFRKLHWGPQHSGLLGAARPGWLDRAYLIDGHGFGTSLHAVHLTGGRYRRYVDRKKILLAVQLWHAAIAIALAILWMAHLLNPYLILASAFLFSAGFAFGSPAHSSVIAEMVSSEELGSAYTLAGLQMDVSGIIGPLLSALLIPLAGVSFIFGANGLGFLLMFLAILQWKRPKVQSSLPLENFFESLTTAIRYVRYTPGIKILLARHTLFSFFISIIPSLMPVVGLKELHLKASHLGISLHEYGRRFSH
jgi:hypothetical protein